MKGDRRIKELDQLANVSFNFTKHPNPYVDITTYVFIIADGQELIIAQQGFSYVEAKEYYDEIRLTPKELSLIFDKVKTWGYLLQEPSS